MDLHHYKVSSIGNIVYCVITSLESPYNTLMIKCKIQEIEQGEGDRIFYYCSLIEFCNKTEYLHDYLNNKTFNLTDIKTKRSRDKTLRFTVGIKSTDYLKQFERLYSNYFFKIPIAMALEKKEDCKILIHEFENATIRYFNDVIENFDNKFQQ